MFLFYYLSEYNYIEYAAFSRKTVNVSASSCTLPCLRVSLRSVGMTGMLEPPDLRLDHINFGNIHPVVFGTRRFLEHFDHIFGRFSTF